MDELDVLNVGAEEQREIKVFLQSGKEKRKHRANMQKLDLGEESGGQSLRFATSTWGSSSVADSNVLLHCALGARLAGGRLKKQLLPVDETEESVQKRCCVGLSNTL